VSDLSKKRWALALTSLAAFLVVFDSQVMTVALATIRSELHASFEALQWTLNAYTLTFSVLLLTGAALCDRFGRRRIFVSGIGLFVAASAACALAPNVTSLIVARTIQGVGGALMLPLAITLLSVAYPPAERGRAIGFFTAFTGLALICGPVLGGAITQGISWHAIFWINVPLGLIAIPLIRARVEESRAEAAGFDLGVRCRIHCVGRPRARADDTAASIWIARVRNGQRNERAVQRIDVRHAVFPAAVLADGTA
jgi:MFS family permease